MKLALFGATGTTGSALVGQALAAGHELRVLARTPSKVTCMDHRLTVTEGNAKDPAAVRDTVAGAEAVVSGDPHNLGRKLILPMLRLGSRTLIADSRAMADSVRHCGLDWTVVRTPRITRGESTGTARFGALAIGPWNSVVNADVAGLVLRCLDDPATIGTAPMIANGRGQSALGVLRTLHDIVRPPREVGEQS